MDQREDSFGWPGQIGQCGSVKQEKYLIDHVVNGRSIISNNRVVDLSQPERLHYAAGRPRARVITCFVLQVGATAGSAVLLSTSKCYFERGFNIFAVNDLTIPSLPIT